MSTLPETMLQQGCTADSIVADTSDSESAALERRRVKLAKLELRMTRGTQTVKQEEIFPENHGQEDVVMTPRTIKEFPVTSFDGLQTGAPKKHVRYISRVQKLPTHPLRQEWMLRDGVLGYEFNYDVAELTLYQLEDGEIYGPQTRKAVLGFMDWSVLSLAVSQELKRLYTDFDQNEKLVCAVWESRAGPSGRCYYRALREITLDSDEFVLHYFNSECGIYNETLRLPTSEWNLMMEEKNEMFGELFQQCQSSESILCAKKTLAF